jgi:hypothetical protein
MSNETLPVVYTTKQYLSLLGNELASKNGAHVDIVFRRRGIVLTCFEENALDHPGPMLKFVEEGEFVPADRTKLWQENAGLLFFYCSSKTMLSSDSSYARLVILFLGEEGARKLVGPHKCNFECSVLLRAALLKEMERLDDSRLYCSKRWRK